MKMKAVQISGPRGKFELVEKNVPKPGPQEVLIKVEACGICHSDSMTVEGAWPGIEYPRVPGHEIAGVIKEVGAAVDHWRTGDRVGVGWFGGNCGQCERCRRGDFVLCQKGQVPGISYDGGYAEYMVAPVGALAKIPESLQSTDAAPLLCAGITTFNAIRNSGIRVGDLVAILGVGGLGHLGVQYAAKCGFETVAIARGKEKERYAKSLGAHHYIDSTSENVGQRLQSLGGAKLILATATNGKAMTDALSGLGVDGKLIVVGVAEEPLQVATVPFIMGRLSVMGWPSGVAADSEDTLRFSARTEIRPQIEVFPLDKAEEAYKHMMSGKARFRVVLKP